MVSIARVLVGPNRPTMEELFHEYTIVPTEMYIDHSDAPDYCDSYVVSAYWEELDRELTEEELDYLHDNYSDWVYEWVLSRIY